MNFWISALLGVGAVVALALLALPGWDVPPIESSQQGFRGVAMNQVDNPRTEKKLEDKNQVPPPPYEIGDDSESPMAGDFYENVQILGDISSDRFNRLMLAMSEWVAPEEEGCAYCHNLENMADDSKYTHMVSRRMLQMTRHINNDWTDHVQGAGVTCYTCHRGQPVPEYVWFGTDGDTSMSSSSVASSRQGQNIVARNIGSTSLPYDALSKYLLRDEPIRVHSKTPLAQGTMTNIKDTEGTYALMIHMSTSLGVNCTYCHNSRAFDQWDQSTPQRITAYHGIEMARSLNQEYLEPLGPVYPDYRLGPKGDAPKVNCTTCHQNIAKPLYGVSMVSEWPSIAGPAQLSTDEDAGGMDAASVGLAEPRTAQATDD